ncbi:MAG TPA: hypothetical protein VEC13_03255 [Candidatus Paceibacterota bacterium]|nr:hypothetical protein [Candidatus Paceibacterota bacterium]
MIANFFSFKDAFESNAPYMFGAGHITFIILSLILVPILARLSKRLSEEAFKKILIVIFVATLLLEIFKIYFESSLRFEAGLGFEWGGILPLYICSMFIYMLPFAIWAKNSHIKRAAVAFLATFGIIGGVANSIHPNILNEYPVWSFAGLHSLVFHFVMITVGVSLWVRQYYKAGLKDILLGYAALLVFAIPIAALDYIFMWDYMYLLNGGQTPINDIYKSLTPFVPAVLWPVVMLGFYFLLSVIIFYLPIKIFRGRKKSF